MKGIMKKVWELHRWCNAREWLLLLLILVGILRIPTLITPNFYGDEEIYFVMGRAWSEGVPLYEAMFDHKPPLIYIVAGIFSTIPLFRGFLLVSMLIHTIVFWIFAQRFWGERHPYLAKLSSLIFVVLTTIPTFEGHIVNAELLMMLPVTISLLMIWKEPKISSGKKLLWYFGAGVVAGIGWLYKIPVVFDIAAIGLFVFIFAKKTWLESIKEIFSPRLWMYLGGFALPLLASFGYYFLKGHGESYLATVFTVNLGYVSSWKSESFTTFNPFKSGLVVRGVILMGYTLLLYLIRKRIDKRLGFAALWSGWALFGALLSYRPYPHYLQEVVPAISLLIPSIFTTKTVVGWLVWTVVLCIGTLTQKDVGFWAYEARSLYANYWQLKQGKISTEEYRNRFDNARRNYNAAEFIKSRLTPGERIYVWGSDPTIYNLTRTIPAGGKYIVNFHVRDLERYDYVMSELEKQRPEAIVVLDSNPDFAELEALIETKYVEAYREEPTVIYWRLD